MMSLSTVNKCDIPDVDIVKDEMVSEERIPRFVKDSSDVKDSKSEQGKIKKSCPIIFTTYIYLF